MIYLPIDGIKLFLTDFSARHLMHLKDIGPKN
jgi:hypothetical protein